MSATAAARTGLPAPAAGGAILHHRHIRAALIREWSPKMDGIAASIWASQTTSPTWPMRQPRT
jgi:hypothetical protein